MKSFGNALADFVSRITARSFMVSLAVIYIFVTQHPTIEQTIGLLVTLGFVTARSIAEDRAE
jgi:hypothetical protein